MYDYQNIDGIRTGREIDKKYLTQIFKNGECDLVLTITFCRCCTKKVRVDDGIVETKIMTANEKIMAQTFCQIY